MTNGIDLLIENITRELAGSPYLLSRKVIIGYPYTIKDAPIKCGTVAVTLDSLQVAEGAFGGYFGTAAAGGEVCGREGEVTLRLTSVVPKSAGGKECHKLLSEITSALFSGSFAGSIRSVSSGDISFDRNVGGLVLPVTAIFTCIVGNEMPEDDTLYSDITVKLK